jgi:Fic family protein
MAGERVEAFVPAPLPPVPPLAFEGELQRVLEPALLAVGRLDSLSTLLPDTALFLYAYVRKEAVLSSRIEGTQSSLSDLLLFELEEAPGVPLDDVVEVSNYVAALDHGLARLRSGFPLSNRLLREIHGVLLSRGRGEDKDPGEFRRSQNWIGGARPGNAVFVPPPHTLVPDCMGALERFLHDAGTTLPVVVRAGLAHVHLETIHPFLDGNGRVGRLLITLMLCEAGILREPLLYLSLFLEQNRDAYYAHLEAVRRNGDWEAWLVFFLAGVRETAEDQRGSRRHRAEGSPRRIDAPGARCAQGTSDRIHAGCLRSFRSLVSGGRIRHGAARRAGHRAGAHGQAAQPGVRLRSLLGDPERGDGAMSAGRDGYRDCAAAPSPARSGTNTRRVPR